MNDIIRTVIERDRVSGVTIDEVKTDEDIVRAIEDVNRTAKEVSDIHEVVSDSDATINADFTGELLIDNDEAIERVNGRAVNVNGAVFSDGSEDARFSDSAVTDRETATAIDSDTGREGRVMSGVTDSDRT